MLTWLTDSGLWFWVSTAVDMTIRIVAVLTVPRNRRPTSAMAWLLAIFLLPVPGILFFLLIGNPKLPRARRRMQARINKLLLDAGAQLTRGTLRPNEPEWFTTLVRMNRDLGALPISGDNGARLITDYAECLAEMAAAIRSATRQVHVEFYILKSDEATNDFFTALEEACARGVTVRVLMDHWANLSKPRHRRTRDRLRRMGADLHYLLPLRPLGGRWQRPDLRNHRKLLIVDGRVAFLGSQNVTDRSYNVPRNRRRGLQWVDLMVRLDGPVVDSVNAVFLSDYYSETGSAVTDAQLSDGGSGSGDLDCQVVPSGPGFEAENNLHLFLGLIYAAQHSVMIVSPYFIPNEALTLAVSAAVSRGVRVELFVSEISDQAMVFHAQRSYYEALLKAGVHIHLYPAPYILHTKSLSVDDEIAVIGSSNMDMRSFGLNFEVSLLVRGEEFVQQLRAVEDDYRRTSRALTLTEWRSRPAGAQILDNLARLTSSLQ